MPRLSPLTLRRVSLCPRSSPSDIDFLVPRRQRTAAVLVYCCAPALLPDVACLLVLRALLASACA